MKASRVTPPTPHQWRGLFSALGCEQPLRNCECWIKEEIDDRYGDYATHHWKSLLTFLSDVVIAADSKCVSLTFHSVYHTLPADQQRNLLAVLYQHRSEIDRTDLTQFIETVKVECTDAGHPWLNLLWKLLSQHVGIIDNDNHDGDKESPPVRHHQDLKRTDDKEASGPADEANVNSAITVNQDVISVDTESQNDASNQTGRQGENKDVVGDILDDCIIILDDDDDDEVDGLVPAAKKIKVEMKTAAIGDNPDDDKLLAQELMDQGVRLRELLHSSPEDPSCSSCLQIRLDINEASISAVCKCCHLHSLPESRLAVLCDVLAKMTDVVGYTTCSVIVSGLLTTKLRELDQTASRVLLGVVTQLVNKFPRQTMDAIITRQVVENLGAAQSDILCCLCKESLSQPNLAYLLRKLVDETDVLSEPALTVIHTILDATPDLDPETVSAILDCLSRSADLHRSNLKYGKLLLSLVNKYAKQWNRLQLSTMNQISGNHKTFLSKKVITVLKKNMKC